MSHNEKKFRFRRFVLLFNMISGFKSGRLPGRIYTYNRFKPVYLSWGLLSEKVCDLRRYNVWYLRFELVPFRIEFFATPKDVWSHWVRLKRKRTS